MAATRRLRIKKIVNTCEHITKTQTNYKRPKQIAKTSARARRCGRLQKKHITSETSIKHKTRSDIEICNPMHNLGILLYALFLQIYNIIANLKPPYLILILFSGFIFPEAHGNFP